MQSSVGRCCCDSGDKTLSAKTAQSRCSNKVRLSHFQYASSPCPANLVHEQLKDVCQGKMRCAFNPTRPNLSAHAQCQHPYLDVIYGCAKRQWIGGVKTPPYIEITIAWYRFITPVLFCGHRRSPPVLERSFFLIWEENDGGHVEKERRCMSVPSDCDWNPLHVQCSATPKAYILLKCSLN